VAAEGNSTITTTDASGNPVTRLISDPVAGLQKWVLVGGVWQLEYVLQAGLDLNEPENVPGYPVPTFGHRAAQHDRTRQPGRHP